MTNGWPRVQIGVVPSSEFSSRRRLFGALERAYPVRFSPFDQRIAPTALVTFGNELPPLPSLPTLSLCSTDSGAARAAIEFAPHTVVPAPFRGRTLLDEEAAIRPLSLRKEETVLARVGRDVVWTAASHRPLVYRAAVAPAELSEGAALRDSFRAGRYFGLLPLVDFLQVVTETAPSDLQACFLIDDPNLRALSYGHVSYPALARHAERHGYHIAMAMIPLDARLASRNTVSLFRARQAQLSVLVHGNDHVRHELARARSVAEATALAAQALRRVGSFERRTGVQVSRVMVPPHSACSTFGAQGLLRAGFAALCTSPAPRPPDADPLLTDWHPVEFVAGGLPNISRHHLLAPRDDLPFRAFLGQPLVVYLHHVDLRGGLEVLADAVRDIDACGAVHWMSAGDLAARQFTMTARGDTAFVRLFARQAQISAPQGVTRFVIELPGHDEWRHERVTLTSDDGVGQNVEVAFRDNVAEIEIAGARDVLLSLRHAADASGLASTRRLQPWPVFRRLLTEGRDRLSPALR